MDVKDKIKQHTVHCDSEELAIRVCKLLDKNGFKFCNEESYIDNNQWRSDLTNGLCYEIGVGRWDSYDYFVDSGLKNTLTSAIDFLNEFEENQFEVGKWYKYNNYIGKFLNYEEGLFRVSEYIDPSLDYFNSESNWGSSSDDKRRKLLTDLSEIQPYLPEGHVDKIQINEFKKDDYIVLTEGEKHDDCFKLNHCYKLRKNSGYLTPYLDSFSNTANGWNKYDFIYTNWRYATKAEIATYDELGKPFDIAILEDKSEFVLPEKWCIKRESHNSSIISKAINKLYGTSYEENNPEYPYIHYSGGSGNCSHDTPLSNYVEITFDQFKKYVLKEDNEEDSFDKHQEEICKHCEDFIIDGPSCDSKGNMCEGSYCDEALESWQEYQEECKEEDILDIELDKLEKELSENKRVERYKVPLI